MLSTARVDIPAPVEVRLKRNSEFVDNIMEFTREDLIGFRRPLAATFALTTPLVVAFVYYAYGFEMMFKVASSHFLIASAGLYLVGRNQWPGLVREFEYRSGEKRKAVADLKCGFTESSFLNIKRAPRFVEHQHGVLAFVDVGDFKTLYFAIENDPEDPRWTLYESSEMSRRIWRWMRLPVSREIVKFATEGTKLGNRRDTPRIESTDAWEAVNVALGEPLDGALLHQPFDEVVDTVERLI